MNKTLTKIQNIMKNDGSFDGHMWVERTDGKVFDYTEDQLEGRSAYGFKRTWTGKMVRKPFPKNIEYLIVDKMKQKARRKIKTAKQMKNWNNLREFSRNTPGMCIIKAVATLDLVEKLRKRGINEGLGFKLRCGSLGYIQKNGDIFYEWG